MPTDIDDLLAELRLAIPEPPAPVGERMLGSVLTSWPPARRGSRARAPKMLLAAALLVLVGGSLAYAYGGRVVDAVTGGPAPPKITQDLGSLAKGPGFPRDGAPPWQQQFAGMNGKVVKGSERRVLTIATRWNGSASIYAARTTTGGYCSLSGWAGSGLGGGCAPNEQFTDRGRPIALSTLSERRGHVLFTGHVPSVHAAAVRIRYRRGHSADVALQSGWFLFEVPIAHQRSASNPVISIDVLDAAGKQIGRYSDPFRLHAPKPHFTEPVPSSIRMLASAELPNGGGTVTIWGGHDAKSRACFRHLRNGKSQQFPIWQCTAAVNHFGYGAPTAGHLQGGRHVAVSWQTGLRNDPRRGSRLGYAYAFGWAAPGVAHLDLRFQDGSQTSIPLVAHDFLYVVPEANWRAGHRPSILTASNAAGRVVYRQFLYPRQHCIYPGHDTLCKHVGMATG